MSKNQRPWATYGDPATAAWTPEIWDRMVTATVWLVTAGILICPILTLAS
jgi:hypothetical protein